jgi:spore coat polysaccharide biosynthesis protein SpsF (cytidylyltransferase family)
MGYKTVTVDVEVYVDEVIHKADDQELIDELVSRGYTVVKGDEQEVFDRDDWSLLLEMVDKQPTTWYNRRIRDKLLEARYG